MVCRAEGDEMERRSEKRNKREREYAKKGKFGGRRRRESREPNERGMHTWPVRRKLPSLAHKVTKHTELSISPFSSLSLSPLAGSREHLAWLVGMNQRRDSIPLYRGDFVGATKGINAGASCGLDHTSLSAYTPRPHFL
jgi:hypothetical protein